MTDAHLRELLEQHNRECQYWAAGLAVAAAAMWVVTYVLIWLFAFLILPIVFRIAPTFWPVHAVIFCVMGILLFDYFRLQGEVFDFDRYRNSIFSFGAGMPSMGTLGGGMVTRGNPLQAGWGIAQIMLCAPRITMYAVEYWRNRVMVDDALVADAVVCFHQLARTPQTHWHAVADFGDKAWSLHYFERMQMIWTRVEGNEPQCKLAADARSRYVG